MPAGKTKTATGANGSAASKPVSRSGTATPVSTAGPKDAVEGAATLATGKPDKKAYDSEQDSIKAEIDVLQAKLNTVRDQISRANPAGTNDRRNDLRSQLDGLKGQQGTKTSRAKIFEQLKVKRESLDKKITALKAAKTKLPFRSIAEVDAHIEHLNKQVESGNMKLAEEKRALAEISTAKRSRRIVEGFQTDQESIDADKRDIDELKSQLDDPESKAIADQFESIKAALDALRTEGDQAAAERNKLFQERDDIQAQLKDLFNRKRESFQQYKDQNDRYWAKANEDRAKRAERARLQKAAEEQQKKKELAERLLEEAQTPAFQFHIEDCQTLIDYFSGKSTGAVAYKSVQQDKIDLPGVPKLEIRKVDDLPEGSAVLRKKKGEEQDAYFVGGKGKGKGKKGGAPAAAKTPETPVTPVTPSASSLNVPLPTLSALLSMSIPPPTSSADVPRVIEDLSTKKAWYEANQARVTADAVAKAQREIQRLTGDKSAAVESSEPSSPTAEVEEAATKEETAVEAEKVES